ncbi:hypothetical protein ACFL58_00850 [Elusimicrobiota bacterium]
MLKEFRLPEDYEYQKDLIEQATLDNPLYISRKSLPIVLTLSYEVKIVPMEGGDLFLIYMDCYNSLES